MKKLCSMSFGAGVQSTAVLLMAIYEPQRLLEALGEVPSVFVFADTGAESPKIYAHLEKLQALLSHRRRAGYSVPELVWLRGASILDETNEESHWRGVSTVPWFTRAAGSKKVGMLRRQCTSQYKIEPIGRFLRKRLGFQRGARIPKESVSLWLGISIEESSRVAVSEAKWIANRYPLIELGMDRNRCSQYALKYGWHPVKSRCYFCPYVSPATWMDIKRNESEEFAKAVAVDERIRNSTKAGVKMPAFVHSSGRPLAEAVPDQLSLLDLAEDWRYGFENECQGHCGI